MESTILPLAIAVVLPFAICFGLARAGHAKTAWWLPAGIAVLTATFVVLAYRLGTEAATGAGAVRSLLLLGVPATIGGAAGVLAGRRRA
jgi:hypothetical protein